MIRALILTALTGVATLITVVGLAWGNGPAMILTSILIITAALAGWAVDRAARRRC